MSVTDGTSSRLLAGPVASTADRRIAPAGAFDRLKNLAAMLLREQREIGQPCDVIAGCPHGEDAALLLGTLGTHPTRC